MSVVVRLRNLVFYGYHGVLQSEQQLGQRFELDVEYRTAAPPADDLAATINYVEVYQRVADLVSGERYNLIESLAEAVAQAILTAFPVERVTVRVRKPSVSLGGLCDYVEVEVTKEAER
ncbi:MAG: dihydroneopterin aldolase [Firmicutes bacterium]|nr:dihydroneopterin aldolase [Bacillota bacterium]